MKLDIFDVPMEVRKTAKEECERLNTKLVSITRKSTNPAEDCLYVVIGKKNKPLWDGKEYCVWTMNTSLAGFYDGAYDLSSTSAQKNAIDRIWDNE
jgi:hypothetical protein